MNSFNHYSYGAIGEWLHTHVGGLRIDPENPGYKHIIFDPHPGGGLTSAKAEVLSLSGKIKSDWEIKDDTFHYEVMIPPNTTATINLPEASSKNLLLNQNKLKSDMQEKLQQTAAGLQLTLGSGTYHFSYSPGTLIP